MNLDDRLRAAHQRQLEEAKTAYRNDGSPPFEPTGRSIGTNLIGMAAAAALIVVAAISIGQLRQPPDVPEVRLDTATSAPVAAEGTSTDEEASADQDDADQDDAVQTDADQDDADQTDDSDRGARAGADEVAVVQVPTATPTPSPAPTNTPTPQPTGTPEPTPSVQESDNQATAIEPTVTPNPPETATPPVSDTSDTGASAPESATPTATQSPDQAGPTSTPVPTATPLPTATPTVEPTAEPTPTPVPTATPTPTPTPSATPLPTPTPTPSYATGVSNTVCPSGWRAELEFASLRYVGPSTGWSRIASLVDEQNGPYYFVAWEPNYPNTVSVEIVLPQPLLASDIRVFQDPFTEVSGQINVAAGDQRFDIELSGIDGWRVHTFATPTAIDSFTLTRTEASANIMEVIVCRAP